MRSPSKAQRYFVYWEIGVTETKRKQQNDEIIISNIQPYIASGLYPLDSQHHPAIYWEK